MKMVAAQRRAMLDSYTMQHIGASSGKIVDIQYFRDTKVFFCSINLLDGIHCRKCFFTQCFRSSIYSRLQVRVLSLERQFFLFYNNHQNMNNKETSIEVAIEFSEKVRIIEFEQA